MVARGTAAERTLRMTTHLVHRWRTLLTSVVLTGDWIDPERHSDPSGHADPALDSSRPETEHDASDTRSLDSEDPIALARTAAGTGLSALLIGAGLRGTLGTGMSADPSAVAAAIAMIAWAWIRLLALRLAPSSDPFHRRARAENLRITTAWGVGLIPFTFAATMELRVIAWIVSAWLTRRVAIGAGMPVERVDRIVGFAWGAQAVFVILSWIGRSVLMVGLSAVTPG